MNLPLLKTERDEFDGQMFHDVYTSAINASKDASEAMAEGHMDTALLWSKSAAHWWGRVAEELEKLQVERRDV